MNANGSEKNRTSFFVKKQRIVHFSYLATPNLLCSLVIAPAIKLTKLIGQMGCVKSFSQMCCTVRNKLQLADV